MENVTREAILEMGAHGRLIRARAVEEQLHDVEAELKERRAWRDTQAHGSFERALNERSTLALIAHRKKLLREFDYCLSIFFSSVTKKGDKEPEINQNMIDRAREYLLSSLIEIQRNKTARCISGTHEDKNASMDTRNNFAYCYACGWSGDSIAVYQKLHGASFVEAVKNLQ